MQRARLSFTTICWLAATVVILAECRTARAGSSGSVNGLGNGTVWSSVKSKTGFSNFVQTAQGTVLPGAIISNSPAIGFTKSGLLPSGASSLTFSQIRGEKGGILLKGTNHATTGDADDNPELQSQVTITPVDCASVGFSSQLNQSQAEFNANGNSGTITVDATASGGTALWLRGYEYDGPLTNIPVADPTSSSNASVEFLKQNGRLLFNTLLVGPFDYGDSSNSCPLILPFTLVSSNLENLIFLADTATLSFPMVLQCPPDVNVQCSDPIYYPAVSFAGCGAVTIVFNPPLPEPAGYFPAGAFPIGTTPVTVTATDSEGNTTNCTFTVTVVGTLPVPPPLPTVTGQTSVTVTNPVATQVCGGATYLITGTTTNATTYNTQGTFIVYWTFDDGHGDVVTTNQTVIVHSTAPPVPPVIPDAVGECSVTVSPIPPVAVDPVFGNVPGQTTNSLSYTTQGTNYITWTFTDVNNNTSTAIQRVIVHDDIPPVKPILPDVSYSVCSGGSVFPTPPTTTDNCAGVVTGTNLTSFPITTLGTNVVTWSFSDGNGNTNTAKQNIILTGLSFTGFYSPVGGTGGSCSSPLMTANQGNNVPIKFDMFCGTNLIASGTPPIVQIQAYAKNCNPGSDVITQPAQYQNTWHFNWNTTNAPGIYKVIVVLPDGSSHYFFVNLK